MAESESLCSKGTSSMALASAKPGSSKHIRSDDIDPDGGDRERQRTLSVDPAARKRVENSPAPSRNNPSDTATRSPTLGR